MDPLLERLALPLVAAAGLVVAGLVALRSHRPWLKIVGTVVAVVAALGAVVYYYKVWQVLSTHGLH
jgi:hypothetical protein